MSSRAMRKKFVVQQPPFVANSSANGGGGRPKRREDHNNNDLDHFPGRHGMLNPPVKSPGITSNSES